MSTSPAPRLVWYGPTTKSEIGGPTGRLAAAPGLDLGIESEQEGRGIRMGIGETQIPAQRPDLPYARFATRRSIVARARKPLPNELGALQLPVRHSSPDHELAVLGAHALELLDLLEIDEVPNEAKPSLSRSSSSVPPQ